MPDLGVRVMLFIGPKIPTPAPGAVADAFVSVQVTNRDKERDGFQLILSLGKETPLDYSLLATGMLDPPARVVVMVLYGATPYVLIDGIVTNHQITASNKPGESRIVVTGEDISLMLDLEEKNKTYPNRNDSTIVREILLRYPMLGLIPVITETAVFPVELQRISSQQGTDLAYIRALAERNGFVFYIEPTPIPGVNKAYWGKENRMGMEQPALTLNMGSHTNVDTNISFTFNAIGPATPTITIVEPFTGLPIEIPMPTGLHPPLALKPAISLRKTLQRDTARLDPAQGAQRAIASDPPDPVTASGEIDADRYGRPLQARQLVGVRGAGFNYNGRYYVKEVSHRISRGQYKQSFMLSREGHGALLPVVTP